MRPLPEPMDGEAARPPRSTDDTARIPRVSMDDDQIGRQEQELAGQWYGERGWYDRVRADVAADPVEPNRVTGAPHYPRHQAAKDDLPGPSRAELARLVRQVRALVIVLLVLFVGLHAYALYGLIIG